VLSAPGLALVAVAAVALIVALRDWRARVRVLDRLDAYEQPGADAAPLPQAPERPLALWLLRAGYRRPNAPSLFVAATIASIGAGVFLSQTYRTLLLPTLVERVVVVPGSTGDVLAAVLQGGPWILLVLFGLGPAITVRAAQRVRATGIERDLPLALELFATMAEAGLGFDAALAKIVRVEGRNRALAAEFIAFQHDLLAGIPRAQALRQLARRVNVPSLTGFTSALIQAEQVGASLAETLQHQAEDLRHRRREAALLRAQALPVKLVFPLVICFLPGIFISTLAPVIYQMIQVAEGVVGTAIP
jgi:tight adherence protein C